LLSRGAAGGVFRRRRHNLKRKALLRKEKAMVAIKVQGGTPSGTRSLCQTCSRGHIIKGFRASEVEVFCRQFYIEREIRFAVCECTFYEDRRLASKSEMEEIAWFLTTRKAGRTVGFVSAEKFRAEQEAASSLANTNSTELDE
jgi:hypothetical protein